MPGVEGIALVLKAHLVGKNPLNIEQQPAHDPRSSPTTAAWAAATAPWIWRCTISPARFTTCRPSA